MEKQQSNTDQNQAYAITLKEVTDIFESCGCTTEVSVAAPSQVALIIRGPISLCPSSIFAEHVDRAKELMQQSHPEVAFTVEEQEERL